MRILLHALPFVDYHTDTLFDGLCQVVGKENVDDYPTKQLLHEIVDQKYPSTYNYPINRSDEEKLELLSEGKYDLILTAIRPIKAIQNKGRNQQLRDHVNYLDEIVKINKHNIPIIIVDGCDYKDLEPLAIEKAKPKLYFKREFSPAFNYPDFVKPLSLSLSNKLVPEKFDTHRVNCVWWYGKWTTLREPYLKMAGVGNGYASYDRYTRKLRESMIGLSLFGYGEDTVRYYEIPANGAMLLAQKPTVTIENNFVDGETAVFFNTPKEMVEKINYCWANPEYVDKIRLAGNKLFNKYHTSSKRAEQLLAQICT